MASFPSSYIPTVASQVTRAADVASMTGANFSSWYRQDEGAFAVKFVKAVDSNDVIQRLLNVSDGTSTNRLVLNANPLKTVTLYTTNGAASTTTSTPYVDAVTSLVAGAYKASDFALSMDSVAANVSSSSPPSASLTVLHIGAQASAGSELCGHIASVRYYPQRLSNEQLQTLSTQ